MFIVAIEKRLSWHQMPADSFRYRHFLSPSPGQRTRQDILKNRGVATAVFHACYSCGCVVAAISSRTYAPRPRRPATARNRAASPGASLRVIWSVSRLCLMQCIISRCLPEWYMHKCHVSRRDTIAPRPYRPIAKRRVHLFFPRTSAVQSPTVTDSQNTVGRTVSRQSQHSHSAPLTSNVQLCDSPSPLSIQV